MTLALAVYRIATSLLAPIYRWRAARGLDPAQQRERVGLHESSRHGVIWCQAPSMGELDVLAPLMPALLEAGDVLVTTHSTTGAQKAAGMTPLTALAPIDTPAATAQFIATWQPKLAVFVESDLPANMMQALKHHGIPYALIAARASNTRKRLPETVTKLLEPCAVLTAASEPVAAELRALGLRVDAVEDLKSQKMYSHAPPPWADALGGRPVWLAASTHPEDHDLIFKAHELILKHAPDALLLIAPRHPSADQSWLPEQFETLFHSSGAAPTAQTQVFVMDALGQMGSLHAVAPVTYIGGGNGTLGGHSPWEAVAAGNHVITGPETQNNASAFGQIEHHVVQTPRALEIMVRECWDSPAPTPVLPQHGTATRDALLAVLAQDGP